MMPNLSLKHTLVFSLSGHLALFLLFSFTFGTKAVKPDYAPLTFWGEVFWASQLQPDTGGVRANNPVVYSRLEPVLPAVDKEISRIMPVNTLGLKPRLNLAFNQVKSSFTPSPSVRLELPKRKESVLMFYPLLPYQLQLYFKDRQTVHIELGFNIVSSGRRKSIQVKRKISSGNLEADLLSSRYFGHYLFIQQARFTPDNWQTVKIDLSTQKLP